jgi:ABC-2 type transport system ATP-binding protein
VGLMHYGKLLVVDTPKALKASFQGELLEARASDMWLARKALAASPLVRQALAMGDRLMITVDNAAQAAGPLTKVLEDAGLKSVSIALAHPTLEDLFVQVMRREEKTGEKTA